MGHAYVKIHVQRLPKAADLEREKHLKSHWVPLAGSRWVRPRRSLSFVERRLHDDLLTISRRTGVPHGLALGDGRVQDGASLALPLAALALVLDLTSSRALSQVALAAYEAQFLTSTARR